MVLVIEEMVLRRGGGKARVITRGNHRDERTDMGI